MNAKKGLNNIITSFLSQIITIALGIVIPRLVLVNLGSEANGLLSSINQILIYVGLLEAGVGAASMQALYSPVAKDEKQSISEILAATNYFYRRTGTVYFAVVLFLTFVFPFTLHYEMPRTDIMWVMLLSGMPGVINYYFQGKYKILLQAEGKSYILTNLTTIINVLTSISKIILLLKGFSIVALQTMYLFFCVAQMLFIAFYMQRNYKWLNLRLPPNYTAISQSRNALVHQVSSLIFNNTDVILLTYFCGLNVVSVYSMYALLLGMITTLISNFGGFSFVLGQTFNTDFEQYLKLHDVYELFNMTLTFCLFCIAGIFILPFVTLYTAGVNDIYYVDRYLPYLFTATYLLSSGRQSSSLAINFAQHFKQTQWRSILESCINLTVSLIAVSKFGIYGVLIGTIAALLYRTNDMIIYANKHILHRSPWVTYRRWLINLILFIVITAGTKIFFAHIALDTYFSIIGWAIVSCIVIIPVFFITMFLFDKETFRFAKSLLRPYCKTALAKLRRG